MTKYTEGIRRSFDYMRKDKERLEEDFETLYSEKSLRIIKLNRHAAKVKAIDLALKELGYLLSSSQRQEIGKEESLVIGAQWAIEMQDNLLYIAPYMIIDMSKTFKEQCRVLKIPKKIRPYIFKENIDPFLISHY